MLSRRFIYTLSIVLGALWMQGALWFALSGSAMAATHEEIPGALIEIDARAERLPTFTVTVGAVVTW